MLRCLNLLSAGTIDHKIVTKIIIINKIKYLHVKEIFEKA